jgi:hypothetical protein
MEVGAMNATSLRIALVVSVLSVGVLSSEPPDADVGWSAFFGNLHSHSGVSDGVERPATAFTFAQTDGKLDFLCLSEHNHMSDKVEMTETDLAAATATSATFVGLAGQEFSVIDHGNHVNVYDVVEPIPQSMNSNYKLLFGKFLKDYQAANPSRIVVGQFNHAKSIEKDYGIVKMKDFPNYEGDWASFIKDVDPWVSLIAVISGPADSSWPKDKPPLKDEHRDMDEGLVRIWHRYVDRGMHLSPVADQDNHRVTWGTRTKARTGVWLNGPLTKEGVLTALKDGRTFASEDPHLRLWFSVNGQPMGAQLADPGESDLDILVRVTDAEEPTARYVATLFRDVPGDDDLPIAVEESDQLKNGEAWRVLKEHMSGSHEVYFVRVRQVESGMHVDDAWSAPIWINANGGPSPVDDAVAEGFVRSKNSKVYHHRDCAIAKQIEANGNLIAHTPATGDGTRLHKNCPTS